MPVLLIAITFMLAEIAAFILVGKAIGVLATLGLVVFGMVAGMVLLRRQGFSTLTKMQAELQAGRTPAKPLAEGAVLTVAALLIIIPGFLSDLAGIALFVPAVRGWLWRIIRRKVPVRVVRQNAASPARTTIVDLDPSEHTTPRAAQGRPDSPWRPPGGPGA